MIHCVKKYRRTGKTILTTVKQKAQNDVTQNTYRYYIENNMDL